ncbi:hypothetical protein [Paenarthrobacter aurescens]|uniref:Uncharacterized protein n=1 Tax=Paenarthrobacter aurescens TaxID=43663 RepID=A0A4Y3ND04_PAEAU|nr:hypothetical protein [Paenarthrobacter aurescens]MDO6145390.1 hypothetical protein [Paenarthrobacter aurescens]MDO6149195.1 hypothetical protein [Paenarthrobacter aurescens]MDO6160439.1 hypothetical protein [Paenarthrobacter aurescens]MDO6164298.1 hypothetical protein [Paenarthrobacter aurescens]GEB19582.1 hypothetical protein AAU01_23370 [Paenarthrobacter aurescens]
MTDQISAQPTTVVGRIESDSLRAAQDAAGQAGESLSQTRAVVTVREQFNPLGAGLRSIWPQSVVGF